MATEILRPNGEGDETNIAGLAGAATHWEAVDEEVADDDTTYVEQSSQDFARDFYNIESSEVGAGTINKIIISVRVKDMNTGGSGDRCKICVKSGSTADEVLKTQAYNTWEVLNEEWDTNPDTSSAWTWSDIEDLQIGVSLTGSAEGKGTANNRCTQVYVEIDYTEASGTNTQINIGDTWKEISAMKINIGDTWKEVASAKINIGDDWKEVF